MYDLVGVEPQNDRRPVVRDRFSSPLEALRASRTVARLLIGGLLIGALILSIGWLLTKVLDDRKLLASDLHVDRWLAAHRTHGLDQVTAGATWLAETPSAVGVAFVAFFVLRLWLHRWRESWMVLTALTGQLLVFLMCTSLIDRPRPPVHRLDAAPPTSSFPSGHTGAAVAIYGSLAVVLLIHSRRHSWLRLVVLLLALLPFAVAASRLYRGMHYPTDVTAGAINGLLWIVLAVTTLFPRLAESGSRVVGGTEGDS